MIFNLFREEAADLRSERQQLDHLLMVSAPHERILLMLTGVVLVVFSLWLLLGSIARSVTHEGVLVSEGRRYDVVVLEPGNLMEFKVGIGDSIATGEQIASQTVPELDRELIQLRNNLALLTTEIEQSEEQEGALHTLSVASRFALGQLEARRNTRSLVVSHTTGQVVALHGKPGDYLPAGTVIAQIRSGEAGTQQAILNVSSQLAQRLEPGMSAEVEFNLPGDTVHRVQGEVVSVISGPLPSWLAPLLHVPAEYGHRVEVKLHMASSLPVSDGTNCRVRIETGRSNPLDILLSGFS